MTDYIDTRPPGYFIYGTNSTVKYASKANARKIAKQRLAEHNVMIDRRVAKIEARRARERDFLPPIDD